MLRSTPLSRLIVTGTLLGCLFAGCGEPAPPPIEMNSTDDVDAEVLELVRRTLSGLKAHPEDTARRVDLALVYEANELWHEANQAWAQALQMQEQQGVNQGANTKGVQVYHLALCTRQAGEIEQARELLFNAVEIAPDLPAAHHELAETLLEVGNLDEAEVHFAVASFLSQKSPDPLVGLALVHLGRDESVEAEREARRALAIEPGLKRAHYALGLALRGQGRLDEAERELTLGLGGKARNLSDSLTARLQSFKTGYHAGISDAVSYVSAGHPRQAIAILEPLLAGHPDDEALLNNLSVAYTHLGEQKRLAGNFEAGERYTRKAREVLLKVVVLDPTGFPAYINLAVAELALGMNADALKHAEAAVRYAPDVARTRFVRGQAYMRYRRWQEAYADLKKAIQIEGDKADQHAILGEICQALGKHAEAIQEFETALRFDDPSVQLAWLGIGFSAALIGDFEKAATAYEEARTTIGANDPRVQRLQQVIRGR